MPSGVFSFTWSVEFKEKILQRAEQKEHPPIDKRPAVAVTSHEMMKW